jgi:hypothetical protein
VEHTHGTATRLCIVYSRVAYNLSTAVGTRRIADAHNDI